MGIRANLTVLSLCLALAPMLTACSQEKAKAPSEVEAPAPLPAGRQGAYQAASMDPETFVRALYAAYGANDPRPEPGRDPLYSRTLNALVGEDFRRSNGKPWLKNDPVCDCTEASVNLTQVTVQQTDRTNATAEVVFTVDGIQKTQVLTLVREATQWRVADVKAPGKPALSESLFKAIE